MLSQNVPNFCIHRNRSHANIGHPNLWIIFCSFPICLENLQFISSQTSWKVHRCVNFVLQYRSPRWSQTFSGQSKKPEKNRTVCWQTSSFVAILLYFWVKWPENTISLFIQSVLWTCLQHFMIQWPDHSFYKLDYDFFQG